MTYHEFVLCGKFCFAFWNTIGDSEPHQHSGAREAAAATVRATLVPDALFPKPIELGITEPTLWA
jgi:hypothetical protein